MRVLISRGSRYLKNPYSNMLLDVGAGVRIEGGGYLQRNNRPNGGTVAFVM